MKNTGTLLTGKAKIKAFTVQDLLVSMAVTSVFIGMVYVILGNISGYLTRYAGEKEALMEYRQLRFLLARDIYMARETDFAKPGELRLIMGDTEILYYMERELIVREQAGIRDTFGIRVIKYPENTGGVFRGGDIILKFQVEVQDRRIPLFEGKKESNARKINTHFLNGN